MDLIFDSKHEYFVMEDQMIKTGNTIVYKANDKKLNREVAIKEIPIKNKMGLKAAMHEIQVLAKF